jgi:DNA phosphorothioation-associated putative methyltransferase
MGMPEVGKFVGQDRYVHVSALAALPEHCQNAVQAALSLVPEARDSVNVVKFNERVGRLSLLEYREFFEDPFPSLMRSWSLRLQQHDMPSFRSYSDSLNPPILHRKELLLLPDDERRKEMEAVTRDAEALGLLDGVVPIGFKVNWERLVASKGYRLDKGSFVPLGNDLDELDASSAQQERAVDSVSRHLTALSRTACSAPVQQLLRHRLLQKHWSFFDYGCGRGDDLFALRQEGFEATGWDPHYANEALKVEADVVNIGFVVNVIDDPAERVDALHAAFFLCRKVLSVAVMLHGSTQPGRPFRDGVLTSRNTFQKYFSQSEFKDYLEHVLAQEAFLVAPGVAFVFADKEIEQRFVADRYRSRSVGERAIALRVSAPRERPDRPVQEPKLGRPTRMPKPSRDDVFIEQTRPLLDTLWALTLDLGRFPEADEVPDLEQVEGKIGGLAKAFRLFAKLYSLEALTAAGRQRTDDLTVYFAMQYFEKRAAYKHLELRMRRDVKAFFGDYRTAQEAGLKALRKVADPAAILAACEESAQRGVGWLDEEHSLQLHRSLIERLPPVLRTYVECGLVLYGALGEVDLVKIHVRSGKLSLMEFEDFAAAPIPLMVKRTKVNMRTLDWDVFEYGTGDYPKAPLYLKSRYMDEADPGYAEQQAFDEALEATGLLEGAKHGPPLAQLITKLELQRLEVVDGSLLPSRRIPDLDQRCGETFLFRDFIECGETQKRHQIANVPLKPETYNALHQLAVTVLDPVIDYFGPIVLTYGVSCAALACAIDARIAPNLDQHASYEKGRNGKQICSRGGAACDFLVKDEDMREVVEWMREHVPFDRIYFYGSDRPVHVSIGPENSKVVYELRTTESGKRVPRPLPPRVAT